MTALPLYLTPASVSFLTQFILSLAISLFLVLRLRHQRTPQQALLTAFFVLATIFIGLMFLDAILSPYLRLLWAVYAENSVLALMMVFLIQFAYLFPRKYPQHKWEARLGLFISLAYFAWEGSFMVYRYVLLLGEGTVDFRPEFSAYIMGIVMVLPPIAFARQCIAADPRRASWVRKLWKPEGKEARGAHSLLTVFGLLFLLGLSNVALLLGLSHTVYNATLSIGILIALWLFASYYINFTPGSVSVQFKLSVLTLTLFLAVLGSVGWFIAPPYIETFQANLTDHQTLRFTPNEAGSYDVVETAFTFESELGERLSLAHAIKLNNYKVDFEFPFYGQVYDDMYVSGYGVIVMGEPFWEPNMQNRFASFPAIFPLMIDLEPQPLNGADGGVYIRLDEAGRLIVTWNRLPAFYRPGEVFTFQVILYQGGVFEITYNGLPLPVVYNPDDSPRANPWLRGVVSGRGEPLHTNTASLLTTAQSDQFPLIENYHLAFRRYLHTFMLPLGLIVIGGSLLILTVLPILLRFSIVEPLEALKDGVQQMEAGKLTVVLPIQNEDEIGYLTRAFNALSARLNELVTNLEGRVAARTSELFTANQSLRAEIESREKVQNQILDQQRTLAALEERERISRDIHDGLAQMLNAVTMHAQAAQTFLADGKQEALGASLESMDRISQDASATIRNFLLGLYKSQNIETDIYDALDKYLCEYEGETGIATRLSLPSDYIMPVMTPAAEEQVLRIIQEALTNTRKHAKASRVEIVFGADERSIQISIQDNGLGFEPRQRMTDKTLHFGLQMIRDRSLRIGGRAEVRSKPGEGTKVLLHMPLLQTTSDRREAGAGKDLRILLVDDSPIFLEGLQNLLTARGLTVIGTAQDGLEAQEKARQLHPGIIVMDVMMPHCDGIEATRIIKAKFPEIKIVVMTTSEKDEHLLEALRNGAAGFLLKSTDANEFCSALTRLADGETILSPEMALRVVKGSPYSPAPNFSKTKELSSRQQEILDMVSSGITYKEIGVRLNLSEKTIKYHMAKILEILQVRNRAQAITLVRRGRT